MESWCPCGTEIAADILSRSEGRFLVYFDPDVDGVFSGRLACSLLDVFGKPYDVYINQNRQHGFFYEDIASLAGRTVIAVDFAITDEKLAALCAAGVKLVNIDHHDIASTELVTYMGQDGKVAGVVINNQYCFEPESKRYLAGAGVVFYTLANIVPEFDCEVNRAIVGLTLLSDIRPLENKEAEFFLKTCYTSREPYIQYLVDVVRPERDFGFGAPRLERNYIDYTFSPKLNALFRLNLGQAAIDLVFGKPPKFSLDEARQIQAQIQDYIMKNVYFPFPERMPNLDIYCMPDQRISDAYELSNFIGLACSHLKGTGHSSIAYIGDVNRIRRGSFRGRFDSIDYLGLFRQYGLTNCAGHKNAFGINETVVSSVDWKGLSQELSLREQQAEEVEYENRVVQVSNLAFFLHQELVRTIAMTNIYVRDSHRVYLQYTGSNVKRRVSGRMFEFTIDGVTVKCFDEDVNTENGFILPIYDRNVLTFYLKNIKK